MAEMPSLQANRVSVLGARGLGGRIASYYDIVEKASEAEIPTARILRVEQLEPLGLAIQMYCLYLWVLGCYYEKAKDQIPVLMDRAWKGLDHPQFRKDVVADANKLYQQMCAYEVFRANATPLSMVEERCAAIHPALAQAPEFLAYVRSVAKIFETLQEYLII